MALNSLGDIFARNHGVFPQQPQFSPPVSTAMQGPLGSDEQTEASSQTPPEFAPDITQEAERIPVTTDQSLDSSAREIIRRKIRSIREELDAITRLLAAPAPDSPSEEGADISSNADITIQTKTPIQPDITEHTTDTDTGERLIHGYFDGEKMIATDGQSYAVPPNYASKSKIVEGDRLKLTIASNGRFIYKQIGQVERTRSVGTLITMNSADSWGVLASGKTYRILTASVTFYRGEPGDEVVFLLSAENPCTWGAVESMIKKR